MKKVWCILLTLAVLLGCFAIAEESADEAVDRFLDTWVEDGIAVEIWCDEDDGAIRCYVVQGDGGDESTTWDYGSCRYDADSDSIICEDGVRTDEVYNDTTGEMKYEEQAKSLTAEFKFVEGEDALIWVDSEGLAGNAVFKRLTDAEEDSYAEAQEYMGRWDCDDTTINIVPMIDDVYSVRVIREESAAKRVEWRYHCVFDAAAHRFYDYEPGSKTVITYLEDGGIDGMTTEYEDGHANFDVDVDSYVMTWDDARENAGESLKFQQVQGYGYEINTLINEGSFVIQIGVDDDEGWQAFDMAQDDSVVKLYDADTLEDTFVVRYDPVGDGAVTVGVKHVTGVACDEMITWDILVEDGQVREVTDASYVQSPFEYDQNEDILGEWLADSAEMTIVKDEERGWNLEIRASAPKARAMKANIIYDCEMRRFVYDGGSLWLVAGKDGPDALVWLEDKNAQETVRFHRQEGWGEKIIRPMFDKLDLDDGSYPVAFDRANIVDGVISDVSIYTDDCYDIVDIEQMAPGDGLETGGKVVMIDTLEDDDGEKLINGGYDMGGINLWAIEESNCWMTHEDDDYNSQTLRAVETLTMKDDVTFTDGWMADSDPEVDAGIEDVTEAIQESENDQFDEYNTSIRLEGGKIAEINRVFVP